MPTSSNAKTETETETETPSPEAATREVLGSTPARPGQREAVDALVAGRDVVAIMPTGWGKSAIYEIAGLCRSGSTLVVSPLIALQHDQLARLEQQEVAPAAVVNSTMSKGKAAAVFERLVDGDLEFLLLAPEQLAKPEVVEQLQSAQISLVVVDEAHCISTWGHDFRPAYLALADVIDALGRPPTLALTATAPPPVRDDIITDLGLRNPALVVGSIDRPNIHLAVRRFVDADEKMRALVELVQDSDKPGIVYVATPRRAEEVAARLRAAGLDIGSYHGRLGRAERVRAQEDFMAGRLAAIVATNAFGLGIDKPDIRFIVHFDAPESLDAYFQEVGRAGRDREPAQATFFFRPEDLGVRRFFAGRSDEKRTKLERSRVEMLHSYADRKGCRRQWLLTYFGETALGPCGNCDECDRERDGTPTTGRADTGAQPFAPGTQIDHRQFGAGVVVGYDRDLLIARFDDGGYKTLSLAAVLGNELISAPE